MSLPVTDTSAPAADTRHVDTLIIGSGFAGLGAAIKLAQAGITDYVVLERGNDVGGTWRDNSYPGAACDVPSHLYSYSFALNPEWTRSFSTQPEIYKYIQSVANRHKVLRQAHLRLRRSLRPLGRVDRAQWEVSTTKGEFVAKIVVSAVGALCEPSLPDIKGIDGFKGEIFHSSRWNHDADLTGKRVAVIGTGASAIQIVPAIGKKVVTPRRVPAHRAVDPAPRRPRVHQDRAPRVQVPPRLPEAVPHRHLLDARDPGRRPGQGADLHEAAAVRRRASPARLRSRTRTFARRSRPTSRSAASAC